MIGNRGHLIIGCPLYIASILLPLFQHIHFNIIPSRKKFQQKNLVEKQKAIVLQKLIPIIMSRKIIFSVFLLIIALGTWTCKKDSNNNDPCTGAWASELSTEANAMATAAQTYGMNPTVANCNAYKQAAQAYVNALEPYGNCATLAGQDRIAWQSAVDNAQASISSLDCSAAF
jgi:hypothetical protein